ncbi:hypothetical protein [Fusobacterium gonidiaformans]|nr:hypothetical protein [Fusobacterium gonidiaformans]
MDLDNIEIIEEIIKDIKVLKEEVDFMQQIIRGESIPSNTDFKKAVYIVKNSFEEEQREEFLNVLLKLKEKQLNDYKEELRLM